MRAPAATDDAPAVGRARILDVAAELFLAHGYGATSLRHLADEAGMKAGSLYYHFASKEELLTAVLRRGIDVMHAAFDAAEAAHRHAGAQVRIAAHVRAHLSALYENGPYTATHVVTFRTAPPSVRDAVVPARDAYEARWTSLLLELQGAGTIATDVDVTVARLALFGAMNASVEWFDPARGSLDHFAGTIARQFWSGVAA